MYVSTIQDPSNKNLANRVHSAPMTGEYYSVNYTFAQLSLSDVGTYKCVLAVSNTSLSINKTLDVSGNVIVFVVL